MRARHTAGSCDAALEREEKAQARYRRKPACTAHSGAILCLVGAMDTIKGRSDHQKEREAPLLGLAQWGSEFACLQILLGRESDKTWSQSIPASNPPDQ